MCRRWAGSARPPSVISCAGFEWTEPAYTVLTAPFEIAIGLQSWQGSMPGGHLGEERRHHSRHDQGALATVHIEPDRALGDRWFHLKGALAVSKCHGSPGGIHAPLGDQPAIRRDGQIEGFPDAIVPRGDRARPLADDLIDAGYRLSAGRVQGGAVGHDGQDRSQERECESARCRSHAASPSCEPKSCQWSLVAPHERRRLNLRRFASETPVHRQPVPEAPLASISGCGMLQARVERVGGNSLPRSTREGPEILSQVGRLARWGNEIMGLLDDLLGSALGGGLGQQGGERPAQTPAAAGGGSNIMMALLPVVLSMLASRGGGSQPGGGGLGGMLGQMLGGGTPSGTSGGLGGLLEQMQRAGSGDHAQSWVGSGQNMPIAPNAMGQIFGEKGLDEIARHANLTPQETSEGLSQLLPELVNHVTPGGQTPDFDQLRRSVDGLRGRMGCPRAFLTTLSGAILRLGSGPWSHPRRS